MQYDRPGESKSNLSLVNGDIPTNCSSCESSVSSYTADTLACQLNFMMFALLVGISSSKTNTPQGLSSLEDHSSSQQ